MAAGLVSLCANQFPGDFERGARHYAASQRAMLERLLAEAERAVANGLEHDAYLRYVQDCAVSLEK